MAANGEPRHLPVLVEEALAFLAPQEGGCYVDCTLGLGGHAEALLSRAPEAVLIGIDRDGEALALAGQRLGPFGERARFLRGRAGNLEAMLAGCGIAKVQGIFADLGVSSLQLEKAERGFSFARDGPLDMRMGEGEQSAADIVNCYSEEALARILYEYGEERKSRRIARAIVERRRERRLETTAELRELIEAVKPRRPGPRRIHPATQAFQALRIEVNRELEELHQLLEQAVRLLDTDGKLVIISYHSLEDRIVKNTLRDLATGVIEPVTGRPRAETQVMEVLTRKPVRPTAAEVMANPRARSARLRAARRL